MLLHYIKTSIRALARNRVHTFINVVGLSFGIACCLIIFLYVQDETSYDQYHPNKDRIYRLTNKLTMAGQSDHTAVIGYAPGATLVEMYPEVEAAVRFVSGGQNVTVKYEDQLYNEERFYFADTTVFDIFAFPLLKGKPETCLSNPQSVVLTESLVKKYFGDSNPMGKKVQFNNNRFYEVTGVMADLPSNTDFPINALLSPSTLPAQQIHIWTTDWTRLLCFTYLLFKSPEDAASFQPKLEQMVEKHVKPFFAQNQVAGEMEYFVTPLTDLHLQSGIEYDTPKGNRSYLYIFSVVALFILLIACINYINLSIAQSTKRAVEVGIRKAAGAYQHQLVSQFIGESVVVTLGALVLSLILLELSLPVFNELSGKSFTFLEAMSPNLLLAMLAILLFVGVVAGSYPAFYLSSFRPVEVLKGSVPLSSRNWLRKGLVVVQFTISVVMIISTMMVYRQMKHVKSQDLGFSKDQIMVVDVPADTSLRRKLPMVKQELMQNPNISELAISSSFVPGQATGALLFRVEAEEGNLEEKIVNFIGVDDKFLDLLEIAQVDGRGFDPENETDQQQAFLVNQAMVEMQGWDQPLGKRVQWGISANDSATHDGKVVGLIDDFHYTSLHNPIEPLVVLYSPQWVRRMLIKMKGGNIEEAKAFVEAKWSDFDPNHPMEYFFLDSFFNEQYQQEENMMTIFSYFSLITIVIACMGLFGLSSFVTQQRTKEIGIRKVLGAEVRSLLFLVSKDFAALVCLAIIIAIPIAWYGVGEWLQGFAVRTTMHPIVFTFAGFIALAIAMLTTGYHALKVARSNPIDALRYE